MSILFYVFLLTAIPVEILYMVSELWCFNVSFHDKFQQFSDYLHCRHFSPVVAVTLLDPKLQFSAAEIAAGVEAGAVVGRADGSGITPYDLRRLQVRAASSPPFCRSQSFCASTYCDSGGAVTLRSLQLCS